MPEKKPKAPTAKKKSKVPLAKKKVKIPVAEKKAPAPKAEKKPGKAKSKSPKPKATKSRPAKKSASPAPELTGQAQILSSEVRYEGPLFRVLHDKIVEPGGRENERDIIRHNGSVVILALDYPKGKKDPWVVVERQYRHAARQFLRELPAGKLEPGEDPLAGAQRELEEETGYRAKKWSTFLEYYASPGFLGESMKVFLAEGLLAGDAHPEADEQIDFRLVKLSDLVKRIEKGEILDGKTLTSVLLYARRKKGKGRK